jgi:diadenosine tetraphosphate (Ap4A) HIT family hydrolase
MADCPLCASPGGELLWSDGRVRVVLVDEPDYPGFVRAIWSAHVGEMTDLAPRDREHLMSVVWAVEAVVRRMLAPDKVNVASLGNVVPHLHWHVIPRWRDDLHFPAAVWAARDPAREPAAAARRALVCARVPALRAALVEALSAPGFGGRGD